MKRTIFYQKEFIPPEGCLARDRWDLQEDTIALEKIAEAAKLAAKKIQEAFEKLVGDSPVVGEGKHRAFFLMEKE